MRYLRTWGGVLTALLAVLLLVGWTCPIGMAFAQEDKPPDGWEEPPPEEEWPWKEVPGEESDKGTEFETPFIAGVSSLVLEVRDCETGEPIPAALLRTEFVFGEGSEPPYSHEDLELIVVQADGYLPAVLTDIQTFELGIGFMVFRFVTAEPVCLVPLEEEFEGVGYFFPNEDLGPN